MKPLCVVRRLLLVCCVLTAAWPAEARAPRVLFDLPYTAENGYYVVVLGTSVGPRRFIFDTGCNTTVIRESLRDELALATKGSLSMGDFEGHRGQALLVRLDSLRMGELLYRDLHAVVLPDSSLIFPCFGVDGIVGCALLHNLAVRFPNADSTITLTDDIRSLGPLDRKRSCALFLDLGKPCLTVGLSGRGGKTRSSVLFDTGSAGWLFYKYDPDRENIIDAGIAADVRRTEGYPSGMGWTNRVRQQQQIVRGRISAFTIAGVTIADVPFLSAEGRRSVLGSALLEWGQVVIDFRHKRFWFLPDPDKSLRVEREPGETIGPSFLNGRLIVGQVWDERLEGVVEPGDRIVMLGTIAVDAVDPCAFLRGEIHPDKPEITVERKDGTRVTIPYKRIEK